MDKNMNAIEKIIKKEVFKDYRRANPLLPNGRHKYKKYHPYTLSEITMEARDIRNKYVNDEINEEDYKVWCLKYNLIHKEG